MWTSEEKSKFRTLKVWKDFRKVILEDRDNRCELCDTKYTGKRKRMLQVHHLFPDFYDDLNLDKFKVLCSTCHDDIVERWAQRILSKNFKITPNFKSWYTLLKNYLPDLDLIKIKLSELGFEGD